VPRFAELEAHCRILYGDGSGVVELQGSLDFD